MYEGEVQHRQDLFMGCNLNLTKILNGSLKESGHLYGKFYEHLPGNELPAVLLEAIQKLRASKNPTKRFLDLEFVKKIQGIEQKKLLYFGKFIWSQASKVRAIIVKSVNKHWVGLAKLKSGETPSGDMN